MTDHCCYASAFQFNPNVVWRIVVLIVDDLPAWGRHDSHSCVPTNIPQRHWQDACHLNAWPLHALVARTCWSTRDSWCLLESDLVSDTVSHFTQWVNESYSFSFQVHLQISLMSSATNMLFPCQALLSRIEFLSGNISILSNSLTFAIQIIFQNVIFIHAF